MIIDIHAHVVAAPQLYAWKAQLFSNRGCYGYVAPNISEELIRDHPETRRHLEAMDKVGTDIQFISPRPYMQMHAEKPAQMVHYWTRGQNDYIAKAVKVHPNRLRGVCALPQPAGQPIGESLEELRRCITELGFVGTLLDTDPGEGDNQTPTLGDEYWYPLYEELVKLDVPALIHSTGCKHGRETYSQHFISEESLAILSLCNARVFLDFPKLKIIVAHGGGSIPYQVGRWRAERSRPTMSRNVPLKESFDDSLKRLYFDTCLHNRNSLRMLIDLVGSERVLFGTENPGSGSAPDPETGRAFDDIKPLIEEIPSVCAEGRRRIFEDNARRLFTRFQTPARQAA